jgi:hypothetical protein
MPTKIDMPLPSPHLEQSRRAGDIEPFPSGRITYLAPLPLPTAMPPHGPHIGELNDVYMDFGVGSPQIFSWQVILGGPFSGACMFIFLLPLFSFCFGLVLGYEWLYSWEFAVDLFFAASELGLLTAFCSLLIGLAVWHHNHKKRLQIIPTRFNRQRREVCFMPEDGIEPSSLSLKIKEIFKFENFCTSMCTLTGPPMVRLERSGAPRRRKYPGCFFVPRGIQSNSMEQYLERETRLASGVRPIEI